MNAAPPPPHGESPGPPPPDPDERAAPSRAEARTWAMLVHLSGLAGYTVPGAGVALPLLIWQLKKHEIPGLEPHAKEAMNFQISLFIALTVAAVSLLLFVGLLLVPAVALAGVVLSVLAGLRANEGGFYRYPLTIRFVK